jgi:phage gpG-like protein
MITIEIKTNFDHLPQIGTQARELISQVVKKTALDVEGEVKKEMTASKSGRKYRRGSGVHVASAPGEAPAVDLGQLINSIQVEHENDYTSIVSTNVDYAVHLEYGTRKMGARPVWRPVAEKLREPFTEAITQVLKRLN